MRSGRPRRLALAVVIAPALAACSLLYKDDLDAARKPGASPPDAGPAFIAPPGTFSEAGSDASVPPAMGCARYPTAKFCADFDATLNVGDGWDDISQDNLSSNVFDTLAYSAPRSYKARVDSAPSCTFGRLNKRFQGIGKQRVTTSLRVRPEAPWVGSTIVLAIEYTGCDVLLYLNEDSPGLAAAVDGQSRKTTGDFVDDTHDVDGAPRADEWTDVTLDARNSDGHVKLTVSFVYESGASQEKVLDYPQCSLQGQMNLGVGFHCAQDTHEIRYDDVRVSWE